MIISAAKWPEYGNIDPIGRSNRIKAMMEVCKGCSNKACNCRQCLGIYSICIASGLTTGAEGNRTIGCTFDIDTECVSKC